MIKKILWSLLLFGWLLSYHSSLSLVSILSIYQSIGVVYLLMRAWRGTISYQQAIKFWSLNSDLKLSKYFLSGGSNFVSLYVSTSCLHYEVDHFPQISSYNNQITNSSRRQQYLPQTWFISLLPQRAHLVHHWQFVSLDVLKNTQTHRWDKRINERINEDERWGELGLGCFFL